MAQELALNLQPGDEIEMDDRWWIVTQHSVSIESPAPVTMQLRSVDGEFLTALATTGLHPFNCRRACGH